MTISIYDATVPALTHGLKVLSAYIDKAEAFAAEKKFDPTVLINARLAPDMLSFAGQVQRASDTSKAAMGRLLGVTVPSFEDNEKTFAELKERIAKTIAFLETNKAAAFDGSESKTIEMKFGGNAVNFSGSQFVLKFLLPNFYFHVTTAHDILRHNGVPLGKRDYLVPAGVI